MSNLEDTLKAHDAHFDKFTEIDYPIQTKQYVTSTEEMPKKGQISKEAVSNAYLEPYEKAALAILNRKSKEARKVIYDHEFTKMSIQDIVIHWKKHMVAVLRETLESIDANTFSASQFWSIIHKKDRLLYMGLTVVTLSIILYVFNIVVV